MEEDFICTPEDFQEALKAQRHSKAKEIETLACKLVVALLRQKLDI